jgi:hypothetical protein
MRRLDHNSHLPSYYVAGVFSHSTEQWVGEFIATSTELYEFGCSPNIDEAQADVIGLMIDTQQVYEEWWERLLFEQRTKKKKG